MEKESFGVMILKMFVVPGGRVLAVVEIDDKRPLEEPGVLECIETDLRCHSILKKRKIILSELRKKIYKSLCFKI